MRTRIIIGLTALCGTTVAIAHTAPVQDHSNHGETVVAVSTPTPTPTESPTPGPGPLPSPLPSPTGEPSPQPAPPGR